MPGFKRCLKGIVPTSSLRTETTGTQETLVTVLMLQDRHAPSPQLSVPADNLRPSSW